MRILLDSLRVGGAIRFENLPLINPLDPLKNDHGIDIERKLGIEGSREFYTLSMYIKDKIIRALLPYVHVVCDRHIYSVLAHHYALGADIDETTIDSIKVTAPDYFFQLKTEEDERQKRIRERPTHDEGDLLHNNTGSFLHQKERAVGAFDPYEIDTTRKNVDEVVQEIQDVISGIRRKVENHAHFRLIPRQEKQKVGFDTERYLEKQIQAFLDKMATVPEGGSIYIEFGGKPVDDRHAERVMPGYDRDVKVRLLEYLKNDFEIVIVVSARDILRPRERGDTGLFYYNQTIRLVNDLRRLGISPQHGVITMTCADQTLSERYVIEEFQKIAQEKLGLNFVAHAAIPGYPNPAVLDNADVFRNNPPLSTTKKNILMLSPGGGSGKFGVCLSQLFHDFQQGKNSIHIKFETFPIYNRPPEHPLNQAFVAATADLKNEVMKEADSSSTAYNKDLENFAMLKRLLAKYCPDPEKNPMCQYTCTSDMGVNRVTDGFSNESIINKAAVREILKRLARYKEEVKEGLETENTVQRVEQALEIIRAHYPETEIDVSISHPA